MSQEENVAAARRLAEAVERGDLEGAANELADEVEIDDTDIPDAGRDSFYTWMSRWNDGWESWRTEGNEIVPIGEDMVLSTFRMVAKGKGSGIELGRDDAILVEFRDGKVTRIGYYNDQAQARQAAGLDPA